MNKKIFSTLLFTMILSFCLAQKEATKVFTVDNTVIDKIVHSTDLNTLDSTVYKFDCKGNLTEEINFRNSIIKLHVTIENNDSIEIKTRKVYHEDKDEIKFSQITYSYNESILKTKSTNFYKDTFTLINYFDKYGNIDIGISYKNNSLESIELIDNQYENMPSQWNSNKAYNYFENEKIRNKNSALNSNSCIIDSSTTVRSYTSGDTIFYQSTDNLKKIESFKINKKEYKYVETDLFYDKVRMNEIEIFYPDSSINIATTYTLDSLAKWNELEKLTYVETKNHIKQFKNDNDYECCTINNATFKYKYDNKKNWIIREKYDTSGELRYTTYRNIYYCK